MKSKRSNTYYMMAWLLTMLCAACVGDELTDQNDPSMVPVTLSSQLPQTGDTRAAASLDLNGNSFEAGQDVLVRISRSGENVYKDYVYTTGENGVMNLPAVSPPYYPLDNAKIDIKSFHPATAINGSHTVASDQTTAEGYVASDLMVAVNKTNVAKTASNVELRYYHMLGKITLTVIPGKGVKRIKTVKLKNVKPTVTFDVNSLTTSSTFTAGGDPVDVTVVKTLNDDIADKATVQGTAVIPVQNVYVEVEVVLDDDSESVVVSSQTVNGNNGYKNYYEITVNGPKINVSLSASKEWNADKKYFKNCSPVLTFNVGGELFNMVCVQGGGKTGYYAQYGSNPSSSQCRMKHDFYIGQTEVTQALWTAVMGSNPAYFSDDRNKPVERVSWNMICEENGFLDKLNQVLANQLPPGFRFCLPSEVQWAYAAHGGMNYSSTSTSESEVDEQAWWSGNAGGTTHPVATKQPNELGLYDMFGNVLEWCYDWHGSIPSSSYSDPIGAATGTQREVRGGCYNSSSQSNCSYNYRDMRTPTTVDNSVGFRLALIQDQGVSLEESQVGYLVTSDAVCYHPAWQVPVYRMPAGVVVYKEGNHGLVVSLTTANQMYFSDIAYGNKNPKPLSHTPAVSGYDWVCGTSNQYFSMWGGGYGCVDILDFLDKIRYFAGGDIIQNYHDIWTSTMPSQTSAYGFRRNGDGIYKESFTLSSNLQVLPCFAFPKAENEPSFSPASFSLTNTGVGSTATLTVSYLGDGTVTASSNNTGIATVTPLSASEGTATFTVTGVSEGSTTLNVQIAEGSKHLAYTGSGVVSVNVGEYKSVDLGLPSGTKWATCNIGAASPEDYGDYFAWGATEPWYSSQSPLTWKDGKSDGYTWANAPYYTGNGSTHSWSKYTDSDYTVLQPEDDAATVQLGSSWRMPTIGDWNELNNPDNTTWTWENGSGSSGLSTGGVKGYKVAKKTDSSVYIFLPAAGYRNATHVTNQGASGRYWSSSLYTPNTLHGRCFEFDSSNRYASSNSRNYGFTVRPVQ